MVWVLVIRIPHASSFVLASMATIPGEGEGGASACDDRGRAVALVYATIRMGTQRSNGRYRCTLTHWGWLCAQLDPQGRSVLY